MARRKNVLPTDWRHGVQTVVGDFGKHSKLVSDLYEGQTVTVSKEFGKPIGGLETVITVIKHDPKTSSGIAVKVEGYSAFICSSWLS